MRLIRLSLLAVVTACFCTQTAVACPTIRPAVYPELHNADFAIAGFIRDFAQAGSPDRPNSSDALITFETLEVLYGSSPDTQTLTWNGNGGVGARQMWTNNRHVIILGIHAGYRDDILYSNKTYPYVQQFNCGPSMILIYGRLIADTLVAYLETPLNSPESSKRLEEFQLAQRIHPNAPHLYVMKPY